MFGRSKRTSKYPKRFIEDVDYVAIDHPRYKYMMLRPKSYTHQAFTPYHVDTQFYSCINGTITLKAGYCSDGPSGVSFDTPSFMRAAFFHDLIYALIRDCHMPMAEKPFADSLLKEMCKEDGMWAWRAWYVHKAVQRYGHSSCVPENCVYQGENLNI